MTDWHNCTKIYDPETSTGGYPEDAEGKAFGAYLKYASKLGKPLENTVWYDTKSDMCFGADQDFFSNPEDFSFFHQRNNFLNYEPWGRKQLQKYIGQYLGSNAVANEEIMFQDHPEFKKYKDSTILIIGAGPSASDVDWENEERDFTWSCTHFFKNHSLSKTPLDLITVGGNVDLADPGLTDYLDANKNTLCVFEGGVSPFKTGAELIAFRDIYPDRVSYFHTRYFSKLGATARQICLATFLGAKEIKFVGLDGNPVGQKHAFEGEEKKHDEVWRDNKALVLYRRQYVLFWEYLLDFINSPKYVNLGEGHPSNLTTGMLTKNEE
jgi:hypothetical protein